MSKFKLAEKVQTIIDNQLVVNLEIINHVIMMADKMPDKNGSDLVKGVAKSIGFALQSNKYVLPKDQFELDFMESFNKC